MKVTNTFLNLRAIFIHSELYCHGHESVFFSIFELYMKDLYRKGL